MRISIRGANTMAFLPWIRPGSKRPLPTFRMILFGIRSIRQRGDNPSIQGGIVMGLKRILFSSVAAFGMAVMSANAPVVAQPKPTAPAAPVAIDADDIGGIVSGAKGPEAGVWVIAETTDLPTRF